MKLMKKLVLVLCCAALIAGCSKLTRENYEKIQMGMMFDQVVELIGEPDACEAALGAKKCVWGDEKKNITVTFMGDKVIMPAYKGL